MVSLSSPLAAQRPGVTSRGTDTTAMGKSYKSELTPRPPENSSLNICQHTMDFRGVMTRETNTQGSSYRQGPCLLLTDCYL